MDPFNNTNTYPTTDWFDAYQSMYQMPATEVNNQAYDTSTGSWGMWEQPEAMAGPSTSQWNTTGYGEDPFTLGSLEGWFPATQYVDQTYGYPQQSYFGNHLPTVQNQPEPQYFDFLNLGGSFPNAFALNTPAVLPTPSYVSPGYWGDSQSGPSASTFYENVQPSYQPSYQPGTGPTRTGPTSVGRYQPYGMFRARPNVSGNAEAGPSTLAPPPVPYTDPPIPQPSGRIPESTADAEKQNRITEEDQAPTPKRASRRPRGEGPPRLDRWSKQREGRRLCELVQTWLNLRHTPVLNEALEVAVRVIPILREREYEEPRLRTLKRKRTAEGVPSADMECKRRNEERRLFRELSQYYQLKEYQSLWDRAKLMSCIIDDFETLDDHKNLEGGGQIDAECMEEVERALGDAREMFKFHLREDQVLETVSEVRVEDVRTEDS